jgi:hypothetical protein
VIDFNDSGVRLAAMLQLLVATIAVLLAAASYSKRNRIAWPLPASTVALFAALMLLGIHLFDVEASRLPGLVAWGMCMVVPPAVALACWLRWGQTRTALVLVVVGASFMQIIPVGMSTLNLVCAHGGCI